MHYRFSHGFLAPHFVKMTPVFPAFKTILMRRSVLAWPAWLRVLAVLPFILLLWLAVGWANLEAAPW